MLTAATQWAHLVQKGWRNDDARLAASADMAVTGVQLMITPVCACGRRKPSRSVGPDAERTADCHELANVIGGVIGREQDRPQVRLPCSARGHGLRKVFHRARDFFNASRPWTYASTLSAHAVGVGGAAVFGQ